MSSRVCRVDPERLPAALAALLAGAEIVVCPDNPRLSKIDELALPRQFHGLAVATSGSTGNPRVVLISRVALLWAAEASLERLGGPGWWANPLPLSHIGGLMTLVRALVADRPQVNLAGDLSDLPPGHGQGYLSLVPTQLQRALADRALSARLGDYAAVLVGGARLDPALREACQARAINLISTYGMTETAGGVVYDGRPLPGVVVTLSELDEAGVGRVHLQTPSLFSGYLGDPVATARVCVEAGFLSGDRGRFVNDRLEVLGRVDEVVQSGGVSVDLAELQIVLEQVFPGQVACFAVADPTWGATVIVASTGPELAQIRQGVRDLVASAAYPRGFLRLAQLPRTTSGKIDTRALAERWRQDGKSA